MNIKELLKNPHWINATIRKNGAEFVIEVDSIKEIISALEAENKRLRNNLVEYVEHHTTCIRSFWCAGEPTEDGGYREKFGDKWYQSKPVDETPKCNCGLDEALAEKI